MCCGRIAEVNLNEKNLTEKTTLNGSKTLTNELNLV